MNRKEFNEKNGYRDSAKTCETCKFMMGSYLDPSCLRMKDLDKQTIGNKTFSMSSVSHTAVCNLWEE